MEHGQSEKEMRRGELRNFYRIQDKIFCCQCAQYISLENVEIGKKNKRSKENGIYIEEKESNCKNKTDSVY